MLLCTLVLVLAVLPPFVGYGFRHALMQGFDLACHQIPERSFQVGGVPLALCHRCTGVVVGLIVGSLALAVFRNVDTKISPRLKTILILSLVPMVFDWGIDALGIWANTPFSRTATGIIFGVAAGYTFARAMAVPPSAASSIQPKPAISPLSHPPPSAHA